LDAASPKRPGLRVNRAPRWPTNRLRKDRNMIRDQLVSLCLSFDDVYEDYPFNKKQSSLLWTTIRHKKNKKIFALIFERNDVLSINLKCKPELIEVMREFHKNVLPGFHMNKNHWNTVIVNSDISVEELTHMIMNSYKLTLR
jgi:predicted DNA-binding protein (MmcQ/YjbR family)